MFERPEEEELDTAREETAEPSGEEDPGNEELYVVLRGRARFEIDGETVDAPAGTLVFCAPEDPLTNVTSVWSLA